MGVGEEVLAFFFKLLPEHGAGGQDIELDFRVTIEGALSVIGAADDCDGGVVLELSPETFGVEGPAWTSILVERLSELLFEDAIEDGDIVLILAGLVESVGLGTGSEELDGGSGCVD